MYGGLTWAANSILPALILHASGDVVVLTRWWLTGRPAAAYRAVHRLGTKAGGAATLAAAARARPAPSAL